MLQALPGAFSIRRAGESIIICTPTGGTPTALAVVSKTNPWTPATLSTPQEGI